MKVVVLSHGMGRFRAARLATNTPLLLAFNICVYETTGGSIGKSDVKKIKCYDNFSVNTSSSDDGVVKSDRNHFHGIDML